MRIIVMSVVGTEAFGVGDVERSWIVVLLGELCSEAAPVLAVMSVIVLFCCNVDVTLELMLMPDLSYRCLLLQVSMLKLRSDLEVKKIGLLTLMSNRSGRKGVL